jgi:hypothetical protein
MIFALLHALTHLEDYEIVLRDGEIYIRPRRRHG